HRMESGASRTRGEGDRAPVPVAQLLRRPGEGGQPRQFPAGPAPPARRRSERLRHDHRRGKQARRAGAQRRVSGPGGRRPAPPRRTGRHLRRHGRGRRAAHPAHPEAPLSSRSAAPRYSPPAMRILVAALVVLSVRPALAADTHPFGVRDMQSMDRVGAPIVSPDGKSSVFTVTATDLDANVRRSSLWTVKVDGTGLRRLTNPDRGNDDNPVWSPDGASIWFVSTRGGSSQVWRIPAD